jgi:hypothetical protein
LYTVSSGARPVTTIGPSTTADATNIIPTSAPGPTAPEGRGGSNCGEGAKTPSTGVIAGAVVGGLLGIGLIATALRWLFKRYADKKGGVSIAAGAPAEPELSPHRARRGGCTTAVQRSRGNLRQRKRENLEQREGRANLLFEMPYIKMIKMTARACNAPYETAHLY